MWYANNCKKNCVLNSSVAEKLMENSSAINFKFAQSLEEQVAENADSFKTFKNPSIYINFANQTLQFYMRTHPPAQAMMIALQATKNELEKNSEPVRASNKILSQIYTELQNNLPVQNQKQQQITQQKEDQIRSKLYEEGLAVIENLKNNKKEPDEINSIIQSKLDSLFNYRQINQRVYNELKNWFTMKIFQSK